MKGKPLMTAALLAACTSLFANEPAIRMASSEEISAILKVGKDQNQVMRTLKELTDNGPRLTGSPGLARAQQWAMGKFRSYGLTNVHLDEWGEVPVGFERGKRQVGRMVTPFNEPITFTTMNWTEGTKGAVKAEAVKAPTTLDEVTMNRDAYKGKWLIMPGGAGMRGATDRSPEELKQALDALGIAGRIYGTADDRVHSSGTWRDKSYENRPKGLNIIVDKGSYDRIVRNIEKDRKPVLEFDIENKWIKGPIKQYNVIADIKGTEKPDEMIIICGHLDSWNSPGSQGTCDNGTGSSVAIEAARIIMASGVKPKRTIRFILWSGEEQGLLGSRGYVAKHKDTLDKISAVLNDDGGTNYHGGYVGLDTMKPYLETAFAPTVAAFPDLPMEFQTVPSMPSGGSSDHAPFNWEGVPGFFTIEKGRANYGHVWHTQYDRYEAAIPEYLVQSSTNHAIVALNLAQADSLLPRGPKPAPRTVSERSLRVVTAVGADRVYEDPALYLQSWWLHVGSKPAADHKTAHDHEDDYVAFLVDYIKRWTRTVTSGIR